jgi:hypothetical protein
MTSEGERGFECAEGVVEHVVLLGAPVPVDGDQLCAARSVVAGRFVNGFCRSDWLLSICCRCPHISAV